MASKEDPGGLGNRLGSVELGYGVGNLKGKLTSSFQIEIAYKGTKKHVWLRRSASQLGQNGPENLLHFKNFDSMVMGTPLDKLLTLVLHTEISKETCNSSWAEHLQPELPPRPDSLVYQKK